MEEQMAQVAEWQVYFAIIVFLVTYAIIITEKINRTVIALFGAALMLLFGIVNMEMAVKHHIAWGTIALLVGMMILVGITNKTGIFQYLAIKSAKAVHGDPIKILIMLSLLTAGGSAFLDNVTTVLLVVPVTISITRILGVNPFPYLISEILFSNIGGTATLIGDPPNIMIGAATGLSFNAFLLNTAPVVVIIIAIIVPIIYFLYRKKLKVTEEEKQKLMALNEKEYIKDPVLMKKSLIVLGFTILGFVLHSVIHVDAAVIAMAGATTLMLIGVKENELDEVFFSVEWGTIFFFIGLFTLVGGLVDTGVISFLASKALEVTGGDIAVAAVLILWVSGILSAIVDNIPYVATMIPLIKEMADSLGLESGSFKLNTLWWSLSLGACLGGNATIIGASANVIVAGMADREGHGFTYMQYLKIGAPITLITLIISNIYIYFRYLVFL